LRQWAHLLRHRRLRDVEPVRRTAWTAGMSPMAESARRDRNCTRLPGRATGLHSRLSGAELPVRAAARRMRCRAQLRLRGLPTSAHRPRCISAQGRSVFCAQFVSAARGPYQLFTSRTITYSMTQHPRLVVAVLRDEVAGDAWPDPQPAPAEGGGQEQPHEWAAPDSVAGGVSEEPHAHARRRRVARAKVRCARKAAPATAPRS
jgi:hypothetical protein